MNRLMMKKLAIMKSLNSSGYLRTAEGYPVKLKKPKSLQAITVYGNDGGVGDAAGTGVYKIPVLFGDKTINLYSPAVLQRRDNVNLFDKGDVTNNAYIDDSGKIQSNANYAYSGYIEVEPSTQYTYTVTSDGTRGNRRLYSYDANMKFIGKLCQLEVPASKGRYSITATTQSNTCYIRIGTIKRTDELVQFEKGSTASKYEPYGKISDMLAVNISNKTAALTTSDGNNTDVSDMQDWTQDFTLPKADELTVTADTTVEPSSIKVEYYSKTRR